MDFDGIRDRAHLASQEGLASVWARYERWLETTFPRVAASLIAPPADTAAQLSALAGRIGQALPDDLVTLYAQTGGEPDRIGEPDVGHGVLFGMRLMPVAEIIAEVDRREARVGADGSWVTDPESPARHLVPDAIRPVDYQRGWIEFAASATSRVAVDLAPGPRGQIGQIINFGRDEDLRFVHARGLTEWLALLLTLATEGHVELGDLAEDETVDEPVDDPAAALWFGPVGGLFLIDQLRLWCHPDTAAPR